MFAKRLKTLRTERHFTQNDLASKTGLSHGCIAMLEIEKRAPTGSTLILLADALECSVDYLLGREDDFGNVTVQGSGPALTHAEQQLLNDFRVLSPDLQEMLQATIQTWKKASANSKRA